MYGGLNISTSGMIAQRTRLEVIMGNIANANSITNDRGEADPYRRRFALFSPGDGQGAPGVHVTKIGLDDAPFRKKFDPTSPYAAQETDPLRDLQEGYVNYPNIDPSIELTNAMETVRAYEANVMAAQASKSMFDAAMQLIA
jgi:flagellar basal-body rod protein FlgC